MNDRLLSKCNHYLRDIKKWEKLANLINWNLTLNRDDLDVDSKVNFEIGGKNGSSKKNGMSMKISFFYQFIYFQLDEIGKLFELF